MLPKKKLKKLWTVFQPSTGKTITSCSKDSPEQQQEHQQPQHLQQPLPPPQLQICEPSCSCSKCCCSHEAVELMEFEQHQKSLAAASTTPNATLASSLASSDRPKNDTFIHVLSDSGFESSQVSPLLKTSNHLHPNSAIQSFSDVVGEHQIVRSNNNVDEDDTEATCICCGATADEIVDIDTEPFPFYDNNNEVGTTTSSLGRQPQSTDQNYDQILREATLDKQRRSSSIAAQYYLSDTNSTEMDYIILKAAATSAVATASTISSAACGTATAASFNVGSTGGQITPLLAASSTSQRNSCGHRSLSECSQRLTFTQTLAFPELAKNFRQKRFYRRYANSSQQQPYMNSQMNSQRSSLLNNGNPLLADHCNGPDGSGAGGVDSGRHYQMKANQFHFAKLITSCILVTTSFIVFILVYNFVKT